MSTSYPQFQPTAGPQPGWIHPAPFPVQPAHAPGTPAGPPHGSRQSSLLVVGVVMAAAALLGVLGVITWLVASGAPLADAGGGGWGPLRGQVAARGGTLSGQDLAATVRQRLRDDGGDPSRMTCPDTAAVRQNVTTVCHGVIDEDDWAVVVFFEDSNGSFTLLPI